VFEQIAVLRQASGRKHQHGVVPDIGERRGHNRARRRLADQRRDLLCLEFIRNDVFGAARLTIHERDDGPMPLAAVFFQRRDDLGDLAGAAATTAQVEDHGVAILEIGLERPRQQFRCTAERHVPQMDVAHMTTAALDDANTGCFGVKYGIGRRVDDEVVKLVRPPLNAQADRFC